jgi:hypothetical protein
VTGVQTCALPISLFESVESSLASFVTSLRLIGDVTLSKADARIVVDGGALLQATEGDASLRAAATAYAGMNVRSTILGFGYGQATSRAQVQVGQATVLAARDLSLAAKADNTVSVEVGTTNLGSASNNASNPTGYANAAVAVGVADTTARVTSGSQAVLGAGRALTLDTEGSKSFGVAASGGSFQDGMVSAGIAVGLSHTVHEASLGGTATAGSIRVSSSLADASTEVQAAAGSGGKAVLYSATEMPWASCSGLLLPGDCEPKISIMPTTVPSRPSRGAADASVPRVFR